MVKEGFLFNAFNGHVCLWPLFQSLFLPFNLSKVFPLVPRGIRALIPSSLLATMVPYVASERKSEVLSFCLVVDHPSLHPVSIAEIRAGSLLPLQSKNRLPGHPKQRHLHLLTWLAGALGQPDFAVLPRPVAYSWQLSCHPSDGGWSVLSRE